MGWRVIYIEESEKLSLYLDNIKITTMSNGDVTIPLSDIHTIIIDNIKVLISAQLINKCCENNICVIICSINHMPFSLIQPLNGNKENAAIQLRQIKWKELQKKEIHKLIIKNKITNQYKLLEYLKLENSCIEKLKEFANSIELGDVTNREGLSAKMYFKALFGKDFIRFNTDVINAGLDFGYQILRSQISKSVISKGLNPVFGIIHHGPENQFNLSDDIIEPFRPIIDAYCYKKLLQCNFFKQSNRIELVKLTTIYIKYGNNKQTIFNTINMFIDSIINYFETGDINKIQEISIDYESV